MTWSRELPCPTCGRLTNGLFFHYRWLKAPKRDADDPERWYCVCGFAVGAKLEVLAPEPTE